MSKPIELREADFKREVWAYNFPESMKEEFFQYWTEPNKSNSKMRYELEKTWHLGRRLAKWANSPFQAMNPKTPVKPVKENKIPMDQFDHLDIFLSEYVAHPTDKRFEDFGKWYDFMKSERLLIPINKEKVEELKATYNNDNQKCRCACVQLTLDAYAKSGWTIFRTMQARKRLV